MQTDLEAIPTDNTDKNYVDAWLDKQMVEYEQAQGQSTARKLLKVSSLYNNWFNRSSLTR